MKNIEPSLKQALEAGHVDALVLDLDGVMYCRSTGLEERAVEKIYDAFMTLSGITRAQAERLTWDSYHQHGSSFSHYKEYGVQPKDLADLVYKDLPLDCLTSCSRLYGQLLTLKQRVPRMVVGSNSHSVHPQRVLAALGVGDLFDEADIVSLCKTNYVPKPHPAFFDEVLRVTGVSARRTLFVEDSLRNIEALHALGFYTAQITSVGDHTREVSPHAHAHASTIQELLGLLLEVR